MKLQQLRYLVAVHENGLNITAAARQLHTSQPGVSRQLKMLEEELGFQLFEREGRALTRTTAAGEEIISRASSILREMQNIRRTSAELRKADGGTLSIATTHTQARYVLPPVIRAFRLKYPKVRLHLHQGTSEQIAEMVARDRVDFAIATGSEELFPASGASAGLSLASRRGRAARPSARLGGQTDAEEAGRISHRHLRVQLLRPLLAARVVRDGRAVARCGADCARFGRHQDLRAHRPGRRHIGAPGDRSGRRHRIWPCSMRRICSRGTRPGSVFAAARLLRAYMYEFIELLAPHLPRKLVRETEKLETQEEVDRVLQGLQIPLRDNP